MARFSLRRRVRRKTSRGSYGRRYRRRSRRYGRRGRSVRRRRFGSRRRTFRKRGRRTFRRSYARSRKFGRSYRRSTSRNTRGGSTYERIEARNIRTVPGRQHFRDFTAIGIPQQVCFAMNLSIADMLRRQVRANQSQMSGGDATVVTARYLDITKIDPLRFRAAIRERCDFKVFNTGSTMAYIGVSVLRHRLRLNAVRPCSIVAVTPTSYSGGPGVDFQGDHLQPAVANGRTYVYGFTVSSLDLPVAPEDTNETASFDMNRAWFGTGSDLTATTDGPNITAFIRPYHAKQQFCPFVYDSTFWSPQYQYGSIDGVTGGHYGPNIPMGLNAIPNGTSIINAAEYRTSFSAANFTVRSNDLGNASAFNVLSVPDYPSGTVVGGYNLMPQYNEHRRGPFDAVFKRKRWRIQLAPRQVYSLVVRGRKMVINPLRHGFFRTSWFWKANDSTTNPSYVNRPGAQWNGGANAGSINGLAPSVPWVYGLKDRNPSTWVSFSFRGQTAVTTTGWTANQINEAGPAECIIKRRYRCQYRGYLAKAARLGPSRIVRNIAVDAAVDPSLYKQMNPTAPPQATTFSGVGA